MADGQRRAWPAMRALLALAPLALGLALGLLAQAPPAPAGDEAPPDEFAAARALPVLERLVGDQAPHPVGSEANAAVRERLVAELRALGLEPELQERFACNFRFENCGQVVNLIARLPTSGTGPAVLLTAHYDSAPAGPGVADDLVGVVAVLEAARSLMADGPTDNPVVLLLSDGEEAGLLGARAFLAHPLALDIGVVVNVEARGTRGTSLLFETSEDNAWLVGGFAAEARRPVTSSLLYEVYKALPNDTDLTEYKMAGLSGVNFAFVGGVQHYHTPLDDLEHLSLASLQHQGENVLAAARAYAYADVDLAAPPDGGAIYTYVAPGLVVLAPLWSALPLAALAAALLAIAFFLARRHGQVSVAGWALGCVATLVGVAGAALLATAATGAVALLRPEAQPWYAEPLPARIAVWSGAVLSVSLLVAAVARASSLWSLSLSAWSVWTLAALGLAYAMPGASVAMLVPILVAAALHLAAAATGPGRPLVSALVVFVSAAVAAYFWLPLALDLESGVGLGFAGALGAMVALVAVTAAPLLSTVRAYVPRRRDDLTEPGAAARPGVASQAATRPRGRRPALASVAATAVVMLGAVVAAVAVPAYSEAWPRRLSLAHLQEWEDGDLGVSRWLADAMPDGPLPDALAQVAEWQPPTAILPWAGTRFRFAEAPAAGGVPPTVEVLADEAVENGRAITLRLHTSGTPLRTVLLVPAELGLVEARFVGTPTAWDFRTSAGLRDRELHCHGATCDGREVRLLVSGSGSHELVFGEVLAGLPDAGNALLSARPATAVPSQEGDVSVQVHRIRLP